ncbi:MAG: hypothetical protein ACYSUI_23200 [Planctomycetota bacterium]|jgi:hypothetical protein
MTDTAEAEVQITNRPQRPGLSHIPEALIEHFHAKEHRVRWGASNELKLGMAAGDGWFRVEMEALPSDMQECVRAHGYRLVEGFILKGDWVLQSRTFKAHEQQVEEEGRQKAILEDPSYSLEKARQAVDDVRGSFPGIGRAAGLLPASQTVFGTQESPQQATMGAAKLPQEVRDMVREANEQRSK